MKTECPSQIFEEYKQYYENLLKARQPETAEEAEIECKAEKESQQITKRQGAKRKELQKS